MRVQKSGRAQEIYDDLPDDVKAVLALFPETYCLESSQGATVGYIDIYDEKADQYFFQQAYAPLPLQIRRFISWVRAGMPEGYNAIIDGEKGVWTRED